MEARGRLLVVDDDRALLRSLQLNLSAAGYAVTCVDNGPEALRCFYDRRPDLIVLDLAMPEMNGWHVCQRIREFSDVPIIMLTALQEPAHRIRGLTLGADDYLTKPFNAQELILRIGNILKRVGVAYNGNPHERLHTRYDDGRLYVDLETRVFTYAGRALHFTPQELNLLTCLVRRQGQTLSHDYLLYHAWGLASGMRGENYVKTYIRYLRLKIEPDPKNPVYIITDHSAGYRLALPADDAQH